MKGNRQDAILALIDKENIGTQEELMLKLNKMGYKVTQATVSRDIKSLKLVKTPSANGQYRYTAVKNNSENIADKYRSILSHSVLSVDFAMNMVVIKCYSGMANAAAAALDGLVSEKIVGSLAGDDTVFVVCRTTEAAQEFKKLIEKNIKAE